MVGRELWWDHLILSFMNIGALGCRSIFFNLEWGYRREENKPNPFSIRLDTNAKTLPTTFFSFYDYEHSNSSIGYFPSCLSSPDKFDRPNCFRAFHPLGSRVAAFSRFIDPAHLWLVRGSMGKYLLGVITSFSLKASFHLDHQMKFQTKFPTFL